jgi:hypothetical protein
MGPAQPHAAGAVCLPHGGPAHGSCRRCGAFLCRSCSVASPMGGTCPGCAALLLPLEAQIARAQRLADRALAAWGFGLALFLGGAALGSAAVLRLSLLVWLLAPVLGAAALVSRRGTGAPGVVGRAVAAIALGGLPFLLLPLGFWLGQRWFGP